MIGRGAVSDNITIRTDKQKKRQVKLLAIKLGYDNVSEYISTLLDTEIKKYLTKDDLQALAESPNPKAVAQPRRSKAAR